MGDNDSPKIARDAARQEAMRSATEQAGIYVESYTETQNLTLTKDEVRMVAGTVLRVLQEKATPELIGDAWRYSVHLVCEVDTAKVDLASLASNKAEIARLQKERDALKQQNDDLLARGVTGRRRVLTHASCPFISETGAAARAAASTARAISSRCEKMGRRSI